MLQVLREVNGQAVPCVSMFHGPPSTHTWEDEHHVVHSSHQGEGGEQGDALMHLPFSLGQHGARQFRGFCAVVKSCFAGDMQETRSMGKDPGLEASRRVSSKM